MPNLNLTPADLLARVGQNQIKFIDLQFTDVVGVVKNVTDSFVGVSRCAGERHLVRRFVD